MGVLKGDLVSKFNDQAVDVLPETDFCAGLMKHFGRETALKVVEAFQKMDLPLPQDEGEFLKGAMGALVFLNEYGVMIRMEIADLSQYSRADRINDNAWILKPIATIDAGKVVIEICPGCEQAQSAVNNAYLRGKLKQQDIDFWDCKISNIGHIPVKTVRFPEGVPVVIDRLAVNKLTNSIASVRSALKSLEDEATREAEEVQEKLYAPLRQAFDSAWPDTQKIKQFWDMCRRYVQEGKLVAGWNQPQGWEAFDEKTPLGSNIKTPLAAEAAKHYEMRMKSVAQGVTPSMTFVQWLNKLPGKQGGI